jgi:tetratricopeptide (TPR) repeat protein
MSICFVAMPFGKKRDANGREIDFNSIYDDVLAQAIRDAGMTPYRADEELRGGFIHAPMYEALLLCDFVVADLTTANANVYYELGIRHAMRKHTTVLTVGGAEQLPFDVKPLRAISYDLTASGTVADPTKLATTLTAALKLAKDEALPKTDSPLYELLDGYPEVSHDRAEIFRNAATVTERLKNELAAMRGDAGKLRDFAARLQNEPDVQSVLLLDLMISFRDVEAYDDMLALIDRFPAPLKTMRVVREQYALALNRVQRDDEAETILKQLVASHGDNPETWSLLGRIYKDRWKRAASPLRAKGELTSAIDAYLRGFEADWRDAYPGINALTLLFAKDEHDPRFDKLLPIVRYSVERKIARSQPDYFDFATLVELAVHAGDRAAAEDALGRALATKPSAMMRKTTRENLEMIAARKPIDWLPALIKELA